MKFKLYTKFPDERLVRKLDLDPNKRVTDKVSAYLTKKKFANEFASKESLLKWYESRNAEKLPAVEFVTNYIRKKAFKNIISFGAGECVLEYLLKDKLSKDVKIVATDYNQFFIKKAQLHFPSIISVQFDFLKDGLLDLQKKLKINFDLAIFFSSLYVMDYQEFVCLSKKLMEAGVKEIIDFHAGYIPYRKIPRIILREFYEYFNTKLRTNARFRGKFHGFGRTRYELRKLYRKAGIKLIKETKIGSYKYVAICEL